MLKIKYPVQFTIKCFLELLYIFFKTESVAVNCLKNKGQYVNKYVNISCNMLIYLARIYTNNFFTFRLKSAT